MHINRYLWTFFLLSIFTVIFTIRNILNKENNKMMDIRDNVESENSPQRKCPDVLGKMIYGRWKTKPMTSEQRTEMKLFLEISRSQHGLPKSLQRNDSLCGNVSFPPELSPTITWFRALCDEYGPKPCCFSNRCTSLRVDECKCDNCFDMRQPRHAEFSEWIPNDDLCSVQKMDSREACELLNGGTLYLSGDSYIRHIYTEFLLLLRNNNYDGALRQNVPQDVHDRCTGMYMFTEKECRLYLDRMALNLCEGNVTLKHGEHFRVTSSDEFHQFFKSLIGKPKTFVLFGLGLHNHFNFPLINEKYIKPAIDMVQNKTWPRLLWATPHSPGILKNGNLMEQDKPKVLQYISEVNSELSLRGVPIFNSYNMTEGMMSFDGNHYGLGMNYWKVQIILNYIQELKDAGRW